MVRTLEQWIELYCNKTKDIFHIPKGYKLISHPSRGICVYALQDGVVAIYEVCGDCLYWKHCLETMHIYSGEANALGTICSRNIRPYIRLIGFEFVDGDIETRFLARDKELGHAVLCSMRGTGINGNKEYIVTSYYNVQCPSTLKEFLEREDTSDVETQ